MLHYHKYSSLQDSNAAHTEEQANVGGWDLLKDRTEVLQFIPEAHTLPEIAV